SDKDFFERIGEEETKRYFQTAYNFVAQYKNLGEKYILSAKVHMDESTPHLHIVFMPVIHKLDKKSDKKIEKIACSEYWKGKDS
ncbi:plasmid recombination protein, partial [Klebsiella pneumoniae]|uniref:plasmid recombination protein n=1 Tax=Klebsiella pneumoniae TaxID=573 RepID=UPI003AF7D661